MTLKNSVYLILSLLCSALLFNGCSGTKHIMLTNPPLQVRSFDDQAIAWVQQVEDKRVIALQQEENKLIVSVNGQLHANEYEAISALVMSPDGAHVAYPAYSNGIWKMVLDGSEIGEDYDEIFPGSVVFSSNGMSLAYSVRKGKHWYVVVNGELYSKEGYDFINSIAFSSDGGRIVFNVNAGNKQTIVENEISGPVYDEIGEIVFSPDGSRLAYKAVIDGSSFVVVDNIEQGGWEETGIPLFSYDSKHVAYSVLSGGKSFVMKDGKRLGPEYNMPMLINPVIFGPRDYRTAFIANNEAGWVAVIDGEEGPVHQIILQESIRLSPDGKGYVYIAADNGQWYLMRDKHAGPTGNMIVIGDRPYSRDGKQFIYALQTSKDWRLVIDNKMSPSLDYDEISQAVGPSYSPDEKYIALTARKDNKWYMVVNGQAGPAYDRVYKPVFRPEGIQYLAENNEDGWFVQCIQPYPAVDASPGDSIMETKLSRLTQVPVGEEECVPCKIRKQNMTFEELMNEGKEKGIEKDS